MVEAQGAHPQPVLSVASVSPGALDVSDIVLDSLSGVELAYRPNPALFSESPCRPEALHPLRELFPQFNRLGRGPDPFPGNVVSVQCVRVDVRDRVGDVLASLSEWAAVRLLIEMHPELKRYAQ